MKINIAIVDDELLFRKSIAFLLNREQQFDVVFDGSDGEELLDYLSNKRNVCPDIVLMDIRMPGLNGIQTSKILGSKYPHIKIIALSTFGSKHFIELMVQHGASAYLPTNSDPENVIYTIHQVYNKGVYFEPEMLNIILNLKRTGGAEDTSSFLVLSDREIEVLQLIFNQLSTKEIAGKLCISERTVEGHRKKMMKKTDSKNVVGLILWGIKNQLVVFE
jgi:DNA-binding NarL/FixJ family response regulator